MPAPLYFASEPVAIGAHDWRVIVTDSAFGGRRFAYEFRRPGELPIWHDQREWPWLDMAAPGRGLPAALAALYIANEEAIQAALSPPAEPWWPVDKIA